MKYNVAISKVYNYDKVEIKESLKEIFDFLGYDKDNPLSGIIKPGMRVFIKPNWVASRWRDSCPHRDDIYSVITHPFVIEAVADYVNIALQGKGEILIGDNPSIDADFDELMELTQIKELEKKYDVPCTVLDLRPLVCKDLRDYGKKEKMCARDGDPNGKIEVNLGRGSLFYSVNPKLFRGIFDNRDETIASHTSENQLYTFSGSMYNADVYISIPKMKTHHKAGVTLNLKGLVGTVAVKNQLVHWRVGFPQMGGDEYPSFSSFIKGRFAKVKSRGSWSGNDTIWRMVVDLYNAFSTKKKRYFTLVDGIVGGQGEGPFCPTAKKSSTLVAGENLVAVDIVTARLMGFEPKSIPYLNYFVERGIIDLMDISIQSNEYCNESFWESRDRYLDFIPPGKWKSLLMTKK